MTISNDASPTPPTANPTIQRTTVAGIELYAVLGNAKAIQCDTEGCHRTEDLNVREHGRDLATALQIKFREGWTYLSHQDPSDRSSTHFCPDCSLAKILAGEPFIPSIPDPDSDKESES